MLDIFLQTLPFFALIGLGYGAGRTGFFTAEATVWLTKFIFHFPLSAMIFSFASDLSLGEVFEPRLAAAYFAASLAVYLVGHGAAKARRLPLDAAAVEAQCAVIGNVGFLGLPMFAAMFGPWTVGPVMLVLSIDLLFFGSLVVILITGSRGGRISIRLLGTVAMGLVRNPMIVSLAAGLAWSATERELWEPLDDFVTLLGAAATPGALFAIGASLATRSAERPAVALWISLMKLALHPAAVAVAALMIFSADPRGAAIAIAAAALPVAGNIYMIANHYGVGVRASSTAILVTTAISVVTVSLVIGWIAPLAL